MISTYFIGTLITYNNQTKTVSDWAKSVGLKPGTLKARLNSGQLIEVAISSPVYHPPASAQLRKDHPYEYSIYANMKTRCYNSNSGVWKGYGGRGIKICDRWLGPDGFANFLTDMGLRPDDMYLDRTDNDGDYEPSNCKWVTWKEQQRNRRDTRFIEHNGETHCLAEWDELYELAGTLWYRLKVGWTMERALATPPRRLPRRINKQ